MKSSLEDSSAGPERRGAACGASFTGKLEGAPTLGQLGSWVRLCVGLTQPSADGTARVALPGRVGLGRSTEGLKRTKGHPPPSKRILQPAGFSAGHWLFQPDGLWAPPQGAALRFGTCPSPHASEPTPYSETSSERDTRWETETHKYRPCCFSPEKRTTDSRK